MALEDIFDNVFGHMDEELPDIDLLEWTKVGSEWIHDEGDFPRIIVVPSGDTYQAPSKHSRNPSSELTANEGFVCHIWGQDYDHCRALRSQFILSLLYVTGNSASIGRGVWTEAPDKARRGREYVLSFVIETPVVQPTLDEVTIDPDLPPNDPDGGLSDEGTMIFPSGQEVTAC